MPFNQVNIKQPKILKNFLNNWKFKLLLIEDDSTLKLTKQVTFRGLVAYKPVAYIKSVDTVTCLNFLCQKGGLTFPFVNIWQSSFTFKSSHRKCSVRKGVLKNFAKSTGKHLSHQPATLLKKRL